MKSPKLSDLGMGLRLSKLGLEVKEFDGGRLLFSLVTGSLLLTPQVTVRVL